MTGKEGFEMSEKRLKQLRASGRSFEKWGGKQI